MGCVAALIHRRHLLADADALGTFVVEGCSLDAFAQLDSAAVRALNLLPDPRYACCPCATTARIPVLSHPHGDVRALCALWCVDACRDPGRLGSVHSLLSRGCWTKSGVRLLKQWVLQPLVDEESIRLRQSFVEMLVDGVELRSKLADAVVRAGLLFAWKPPLVTLRLAFCRNFPTSSESRRSCNVRAPAWATSCRWFASRSCFRPSFRCSRATTASTRACSKHSSSSHSRS